MKKTILIIGGTSGIGRAVAEQLVTDNQVIIVGRNADKGNQFVADFGTNAKFIQSDISLMTNVVKMIDQVKNSTSTLDFILHTTDILGTVRTDTSEGLEKSIATNYYSRFLANDSLLKTFRPERIVHVAAADIPMNKNFDQKFPVTPEVGGFTAHGRGQIANDFYGLKMSKILKSKGTKINILNPGSVDTDIRRNGNFSWLAKILFSLLKPLFLFFTTTPNEYAKIVIDIIQNRNQAANEFVLISPKGKGIKGNQHAHDEKIQQYVYDTTKKQIEGILSGNLVG